MSTETKIRRGTGAQCDAMTPAEGEIIYDMTNDRLRIGDASLAGGHKLPNAVDIQKGTFYTVNATGTDTLTVTLDPVPASYFTNMTVVFKAAATNTGAVTLNVNSLGAKNVYKASSGALGALAAGDLTIGAYYTVRYDGTQFVLEGSAGGVSSVTGSGGVTVSPTTGAPNVSINTNNAGGIGSMALLRNVSGVTISNGSTASGVDLRLTAFSTTGGITVQVSSPSGTWRNIQGFQCVANEFAFFIRTA